MARNKQEKTTEVPDDLLDGENAGETGIPGGAYGNPVDLNPLVNPGHVLGTVKQDAKEAEAATKHLVKRYRVMNSGYVHLPGGRTTMKAGKVVTNLAYDIKTLLDQGMRLEEIPPETAPVTTTEG